MPEVTFERPEVNLACPPLSQATVRQGPRRWGAIAFGAASLPVMAGIGLLATAEPGFMKPAGADGAAIRSGMGVGVFLRRIGALDLQLEQCFLYDESDFDLLLITREGVRGRPPGTDADRGRRA